MTTGSRRENKSRKKGHLYCGPIKVQIRFISLAFLSLLIYFLLSTFSTDNAKADPHIRQSSNVAFIGGTTLDTGTCSSSGSAANVMGRTTGGCLPVNGDPGELGDFNFTPIPPSAVNATELLNYDTAVLNVASNAMACNTDTLSSQQKVELVEFVKGGKKLIIYDSECTDTIDYSWLPYPFSTSNPGAAGATGTLEIIEENTLSSSDGLHYIDVGYLSSNTDAVGDMNVMTTYDPKWFVDMAGTNTLNDYGPVHTYAELSSGSYTGLIIYNGLDQDYQSQNEPNLRKIWLQELQQNFNPSSLSYSHPILDPGDILICKTPGSLIFGDWTHVGMYIGNGNVVESNMTNSITREPGVEVNPLSDWMYPKKKWVSYQRVSTADDATRRAAVKFAMDQYYDGDKYDYNFFQKSSDPNSDSWYCSELVWAAYWNASNGQIDLEYHQFGIRFPYGFVHPEEIYDDEETEIIGGDLREWPTTAWESLDNTLGNITIFGHSPIDLEVTDPNGNSITKQTNDINGAVYGEDDLNRDGELNDWVTLTKPIAGEYIINAIPEPGADPSDTYSIEVIKDGISEEVAINRPVSVASYETYIYQSRHTYSFTWYDNLYAQNWILIANPEQSVDDLYFDLSIAANKKEIAPFSLQGAGCPNNLECAPGQVPPGYTITPKFDGLIGGPVEVNSLTGDQALVSQRVLWGDSSFEEVAGTDYRRLSHNFYWPWYDQQSAGYINWVLISNPSDKQIYYEITIPGIDTNATPGAKGTIPPRGIVTPTFPDIMGGPVQLKAYTDSNKATPARVMASQRVLSNVGTSQEAFNEAPGIPATELSNHYIWTWYDNTSPDARNWIVVANPSETETIRVEIRIDSSIMQNLDTTNSAYGQYYFEIAPRERITPMFNAQGGPAELKAYLSNGTWEDQADRREVIASQRAIWGPSFDEMMGYPHEALSDTYFWTWYDEESRGMRNWVLVGLRPDENDIVTIEVSFTNKNSGEPVLSVYDIDPAVEQRHYWTFPGKMGGPVQVKAYKQGEPSTPKDVIASQRVLYNGYFNEVVGAVVK